MHLSERFLTQPWHIHPQAILPMLQRQATWAPQILAAEDPKKLSIADFIHQREPMIVTGEGVAIIEICGTLGRGLVTVDKLLGDTDYDDIIAEVREAEADERVKGLVILADSGGGSVVGAAECRQAIADAARVKPVVSFTQGFQASACYEICAGASLMVATASSIVGSIGTITSRLDVTAFYEKMGVKLHVVPATQSDLKASYWPETELTADMKAEMQRFVDRWNDDFLAFVRAHRMGVESESMRGQCFDGADAKARGLIDEIGDFDQAMDECLVMAGVDPAVDTETES